MKYIIFDPLMDYYVKSASSFFSLEDAMLFSCIGVEALELLTIIKTSL